jgi:glycosyltransferase involved in cell wall biosynthesis
MPVYNGAAYLGEAIASVLKQTLADFEFLIVDDCSSDDTPRILKSFTDPRIRVLRNETRLRLAGALNRGMDEARGEYIARMDADDLCTPTRLQEQIGFLRGHAEVGFCGTWVRTFDASTGTQRYPVGAQRVRAFALFNTPLAHPTVMLRREWFDRALLRYDVNFYPAEDYELWARALAVFPADNLPKTLLKYRVHSQSMTGSDWTNMDEQACRISGALLKQMGLNAKPEDLLLHRNVAQGRADGGREFIARAEEWLCKIAIANSQTNWCASEGLQMTIEDIWFRICLHSARGGGWVLRKYSGSRFATSGAGRWSRIFLILLAVVKNEMAPSRA